MTELLYFILFAAGLFMVIKGSDWFVDAAVWTAEAFRIPSIIIGATIVSICTTLPETFVSSAAALKGESVMSLGNALGSIGVNTGFILAFMLFFTRPFIENRREFIRNGLFLTALLMLLWAVGFFFGKINRPIGIVLIFLFLIYIINNVIAARKLMDLDIHYDIVGDEDVLSHTDANDLMPEGIAYDESENDFDVSYQTLARKIIFFTLGVSLVILGSNLLVDNGMRIAELLHVPTFMIAVIFTSGGTSLPELITVITSVRKGVSNLGIGNIIGANILNIVQVIGISALLHPLPVADEKSILSFQLPVLLVMVLIVTVSGIFTRGRLSKWCGVLLFVLYLIFLSVNILRGAAPILGPVLF
jgi:cation:H+ antiporter